MEAYLNAQAEQRAIVLMSSTAATKAGEKALWQQCVSWGVNAMPNKVIAVRVWLYYPPQLKDTAGVL